MYTLSVKSKKYHKNGIKIHMVPLNFEIMFLRYISNGLSFGPDSSYKGWKGL